MKAVLRSNRHLLSATRPSQIVQSLSGSSRNVSSTSTASSSRAAALAKAAEASATASERLASGDAPIMGPSYLSRQDANRIDTTHRILSDHDEANAHLNLSSSQARRSRAARFGTSRQTTYASPLFPGSGAAQEPSRAAAEEQDEDEQLALAYASPTGTSTSSIYLPEYVAWAISQLIAAANDPKLLRADHLKLAHLTDPQEHMAEAVHIPPKRSSLLHLATVSPHRYAAILAVLAEVRQRLSTPVFAQGDAADLDEALPRWTPDTVMDFDCAAGEGLWAAAQVFREDDADPRSSTSLQRYHGYDRRPNLLKSGKKVAQSSASNVSPADPVKPEREVKLRDEGEEIVVDGITYYEQESEDVDQAPEEEDLDANASDQPAVEYFSGPRSAMSSVHKTFQSVPLAKDLTSAPQNGRTLALSAFALSLMTNDTNRFEAVQAMWDSGAEVIVIIDQATPRGFASVASARAQLLQLGKHPSAAGSHVVAPCSHDKPCPLLHPFAISSSVASAVGARSDTGNPAKSKDVCGFTARYHTPGFLRRTKHSDRGEENVEYSYVVVRRGERPSLVGEARRRLAKGGEEGGVDGVAELVAELSVKASETKTGILDLLRNAKRASAERRTLQEVDDASAVIGAGEEEGRADAVDGEMTVEQVMDELLKLLPDAVKAEFEAHSSNPSDAQPTPEQLDSIMASVRTSLSTNPSSPSSTVSIPDDTDDAQLITVAAPTASSELAMRLESYTWPRLIKSPLKKGGHVTLDACCSSGNIERFTISKASGKQAYQDARKSKWGDLFPYPSRSRSVIKVLNPLTGGVGGVGGRKKKNGVQIVGLSEEEDEESILRELFEDLPKTSNPSPPLSSRINTIDRGQASYRLISPNPSPPLSSRINTIDRGQASYRLISPNLITPTKKQTKRITINYNNKWLHPLGIATAKPKSHLQQLTPPPTMSQVEESTGGFESSLDNRRVKQRRSSRKTSRGDWDAELFGSR
ncbi:hypothetical protein [Sporisorium scitamineum]|uniref:Rsm22-domain-containing protein n=1 Tax=Sporisorium scitamineum TaxID=49012 RepID=A0A0F7SBB2_9BASI|nr:hypothetical protein [Sporisorium scitamineum]